MPAMFVKGHQAATTSMCIGIGQEVIEIYREYMRHRRHIDGISIHRTILSVNLTNSAGFSQNKNAR